MGKRTHITDNDYNNAKTKAQAKPEEVHKTPDPDTETRDGNTEPQNTLDHKRNGARETKDSALNGNHKQSEGGECAVDSASTKSSLLASTEDEKDDVDGKTPEDSPENPHPGLPVDRGWAWVVMIAQFVNTLLMVGFGRALSIFFLEFLDMFDVPVTMGTVVFGIMTAVFGVGNLLVSNALMSQFSTRRIVLTGALINACGIALTSLAPNIIYVTVTHAFIGFSHAMMYVPGFSLLGHYFHKRRSFAIAVANTGLSVSNVIMPPLTHLLIDFYGTRGALLMIAGIELQCVVFACLLRPVSWYTKGKPPLTAGAEGEGSPPPPQAAEEAKETVEHTTSASNRRKGEGSGDHQDEETVTYLLDEFQREETGRGETWQPPPHLVPPLSASLPEKSVLSDMSASHGHCHYSSEEALNVISQRRGAGSGGPPHHGRPTERHHHATLRQDSQVSAISSTRVSAVGASVVDICGSALNISVNPAFGGSSCSVKDESGSDDRRRKRRGTGGCWRWCLSVLHHVIDFSLFRNWLFLLIIIYVPLGFSSQFIAFYFPSLAVEKGVSRSQAALLMPVMGGVDLVSRLSVGYLADLQILKRTHLVAVCMTLMGLACQFCSFYNDVGLLAMLAVVYGLVGGVCNNLFAVVIIDLMGLTLLPKVMGLVLLFNSIFSSVNHVLIGALVDSTGSFVVPYNYLGASLVLSSAVLLMEPLARRLELKRVRKVEVNAECAREPVKA